MHRNWDTFKQRYSSISGYELYLNEKDFAINNRNPNTTDLRLRSKTVFTHSCRPCLRLFVLHNPREIVATIKRYLTLYVSLLPDINWNRKRKHKNKGRRHCDRRKNARFGREMLEMLQTEKLYAIHWLTSSGSFAGPGEKLRTRWVVSAMVEQISRVVINKGLRNRSDRVPRSGKRKSQETVFKFFLQIYLTSVKIQMQPRFHSVYAWMVISIADWLTPTCTCKNHVARVKVQRALFVIGYF